MHVFYPLKKTKNTSGYHNQATIKLWTCLRNAIQDGRIRIVKGREMTQPVICVRCDRRFWADEDPHVPGIGALCDECNAQRLAEEGER